MNKRKPSPLPSVPTDVPKGIRGLLLAIKERLELRDGERGDPLEGFVKKSELVDGGVAKVLVRGRSGGGGGSPSTDIEFIPGGGWMPDRIDIPVRPRGISVFGRFTEIGLFWENPHEIYSGHSMTEIWRAPGDAADRSEAILIDTVVGFAYVDAIDTPMEATFTYWLRFINTNGTPGPFSDPITGTKLEDLAFLFDRIEGEIRESVLHVSFRDRLTGFDGSFEDVRKLVANTTEDFRERADAIEDSVDGVDRTVRTLNEFKDGAVAKFDEVDLAVGTANGRITNLENFQLSPTSALYKRITGVEASVGEAKGSITDITNLNLSAGSNLMQRFTQLEGAVDGASASAQQFTIVSLSNLVRNGSLSAPGAMSTHGWNGGSLTTNDSFPPPYNKGMHVANSWMATNSFPAEKGRTLYVGFSYAALSSGACAVSVQLLSATGAILTTQSMGSVSQSTRSTKWEWFSSSYSIPSNTQAVSARVRFQGTSGWVYVRDVQANYNGSLTEAGTRVSATLGDQTARIQEKMSVRRASDGQLASDYAITMDNNGSIAGFSLSNSYASSVFKLRADKFWIVDSNNTGASPFFIANGNTHIRSALIQDASITNAKIGSLDASKITSGKISSERIDTANLHVGGNSTFNGQLNIRSGTGQQRMEIRNSQIVMFQNNKAHLFINENGITVYDADGRMRVRIGRLV